MLLTSPSLKALLGLLLIVQQGWAGIYEQLALTREGQTIFDGEKYEDYELAEVNPRAATFLNIGQFAHAALKKGGYGYGTLVSIATSPLDKELEAKRADEGWFPMILSLTVLGVDSDTEAPTEPMVFETRIEYNRERFAAPGLAVTAAHLVGKKKKDVSARDAREGEMAGGESADGGMYYSVLDVPLPAPPPFLEKHYRGIVGFFGIIIASSVIKTIRVLFGRWFYGDGAKQTGAGATEEAGVSSVDDQKDGDGSGGGGGGDGDDAGNIDNDSVGQKKQGKKRGKETKKSR